MVETKTEWGIKYEDGIAGDFKTRREAREFLTSSAKYAVSKNSELIPGVVVRRTLKVEVGVWERA